MDSKESKKQSFINQWVADLEVSSKSLVEVLGKSADLQSKPITINKESNIVIHLFFIDGLINHQLVSDLVLKPLVNDVRLVTVKDESSLFDLIEQGIIYYSSQKTLSTMEQVVEAVLSANVVLLFDGINKSISFDTKGFQMRSIATPTEESSLKGSKDSFVETIRVNTATIRRKIKSTSLTIEDMTLGSMSNTMVSIVYMDNMVNKETLHELKERLKAIDVEEMIFTSSISEQIVENKYADFPQVDYTEKPDKFCIGVLDGKIGIIVDGIPFSIVLPVTIVDLFQTTDDYSSPSFFVATLRVIRYLLFIVALFFSGFFISVTTFHQQLIPSELAVSIIGSRQGVPFPIFLEIIILVIAFEVLIEAGTRIYSSIGSMVTLVGAIVVGEAAVNAKFVSPAAIVVVAVAAISNYSIPNRDFANAVWLWQLVVIALSSFIGLFGLAVSIVLLVYTLSSIEVLGTPYLSPFVNTNTIRDFKDIITRPPSKDKTNPQYIQRVK